MNQWEFENVIIERMVEDRALALTNVLADGQRIDIESFSKAIILAPAAISNATAQPYVGVKGDAVSTFKTIGSAVTLTADEGVEFTLPVAGEMVLIGDVGVESGYTIILST